MSFGFSGVRLNSFERWVVGHPLRSWVQRFGDIPRLRRLAGQRAFGRTAEFGCGAGHALKHLSRLPGLTHLEAFEIDAHFFSRAKARAASLQQVTVTQADIQRISVMDSTFDSIFEFNVLHHVENWSAGIHEAGRLLRPGGVFYAQETLEGFICHPIWRRCMEHPQEKRFQKEDFIAEAKRAGFRILGTQNWGNQFLWLAAEREERASSH